jgi:hypothetical protein
MLPEAFMTSHRKSYYAELEALREKQLKEAIMKGVADLQAGRVTDGKRVISTLRKRISE